MALPAGAKTVSLHMQVINQSGAVGVGTVRLEGPSVLRDAVDNVVIAPPRHASTLDSNGEVTFPYVIATDNPSISPINWSYAVIIETDIWRDRFYLQVPYATVGTLEIARTAATVTSPGTVTYVLTSTLGVPGGVATLDGTTKVPVAQLPVGTASGVASLDAGAKLPAGQLPASAVTTATVVAKGDLLVGTGVGAITRLPIGADTQVLAADSAQASGVRWVPPTVAGTLTFRGTWAANTVYAVSDVVKLYGVPMLCTAGHTSGAAFALTNWVPFGEPANQFRPEWYGAVGNDKYVTDGAMTISSATFTSATANFSAADVGKAIMVRGATASGNVLLTTISAYVSPTQVTLAVAAGTTVSAAYASYGTDDTAAINSAVSAATTYMGTNGGARVKFRSAWYAVAGALIQGGTAKTNAQIPLPIASTTANSGTLDLVGSGTADNIPHWQQTVGQRTGTVLHSYVSGTNHGTYGEASVIGGPTPQQGYGSSTSVFSNLLVHIDQIEVLVPNTANGADICGVDLRGMGKAHIGTLACLVDAGPTNIITGKGSGWAFGLALPNPANNAKLTIDSYSCEGFTYGLWATEHLAGQNVLCVYCFTGILVIGSFEGSSGAQHVAHISEATVEACVNGVQFAQGGKCVIDVLTVEGSFSGGMHVADTAGTGSGYIGLGGIINTIQISDPTNVRVIYIDGTSGNAAAPAMPASTVALRNPTWRDCAVTITGGTVTAITVDGVATGLTSGTVIVPSGRKIAITYSVAPTWVWTKL